MKKLLFVLIVLHLSSCSSPDEKFIKISTGQNLDMALIVFNGFSSDTLLIGTINANETKEIQLDYEGFALMLIDGIYAYPLIIGKEGTDVAFSSVAVPPVFTHSPENSFFYDFYSAHNKLSNHIRDLEQEMNKPDAPATFYGTTQSQLDSLRTEKRGLTKQLPDKGFPWASAILQEKLIEEESYGIKTLDGLHATQNSFVGFAEQNFQYLVHSDRLVALINQSFMMLEYINYYESIEKTGDKKKDITRAKELYRQEMIRQAGMWMDALEPHIDPKTVLAQCVKAYYNRSMIGKAWEIQSAFADMATCPSGTSHKQIAFPDSFEVVKPDGVSTLPSSQTGTHKMIIVVDDNCIFSKVFAVIKAREPEKSGTAIIILPKGGLSQSILSIDRNCVKQLYFIKNKEWIDKEALEQVKAPAIYPL